MGLITLVQPDERFWLLISVDQEDQTQITHKVLTDEPSDGELKTDGWSAFECRRMPADWFEDVKTQHTRTKSDRSGRFEETNWKGYRKQIIQHLVVGWKGVQGNPACTDETKLQLPQSVQLLIIGQSSGLAAVPDRGELQKNS
jgi:hypothetical protein